MTDTSKEELDNNDELNVEYEIRKHYPRIKFLESLVESRLFWTSNWKEFYLLQGMYDMESQEYLEKVAGMVSLDIMPNQYLDITEIDKYFVHIRYVATHTEYRGTGGLNLLCKLLLNAAEENGIVLCGHARPFELDLPRLTSAEEIEKWQKQDLGKHNTSLKKDKANAKRLLPVYLNNGFCRFDLHGFRFANRWWKRMGFAYRSSKLTDYTVGKYLDEHMKC